ncbi:MAG TPA: hypothetical protein VMI32_05110 [Candidatus Solibacter sp.]|nr:hypothetical protein [Candidatus Solibacter sp.]
MKLGAQFFCSALFEHWLVRADEGHKVFGAHCAFAVWGWWFGCPLFSHDGASYAVFFVWHIAEAWRTPVAGYVARNVGLAFQWMMVVGANAQHIGRNQKQIFVLDGANDVVYDRGWLVALLAVFKALAAWVMSEH